MAKKLVISVSDALMNDLRALAQFMGMSHIDIARYAVAELIAEKKVRIPEYYHGTTTVLLSEPGSQNGTRVLPEYYHGTTLGSSGAENQPGLGHAGARESIQDRQTVKKREELRSTLAESNETGELFREHELNSRAEQVAEVAEVIASSDWRNMKLPKRDTPESYAKLLVETHPEHATAQAVRDCALWVHNNPKKAANKKYLGGFLANWVKRSKSPPPESIGSKRTTASGPAKPLRHPDSGMPLKPGDWIEGGKAWRKVGEHILRVQSDARTLADWIAIGATMMLIDEDGTKHNETVDAELREKMLAHEVTVAGWRY